MTDKNIEEKDLQAEETATEETAAEPAAERTALPSDVSSKASAFLYGICALTAVCAALWILAVLFGFEADVGYFRRGALLPAGALAVFAAGGCCAVASFLLIPRGGMPRNTRYQSGVNAAALDFCGFILLFEAGLRVKEFINGIKAVKAALALYSDVGLFAAMRADFAENRPDRMALILSGVAVVAGALAAFYFLARGAGDRLNRNLLAVFGVCCGFRALCGLGIIYFDLTVAINSPLKLAAEIALICVMLWTMLEVRFILPEGYARPELYFSFSLFTVLVCVPAGAGVLAASLSHAVSSDGLLVEGAFCLVIGVLAAIRLFLFTGKIRKAAVEGDCYEADEESAQKVEEAGEAAESGDGETGESAGSADDESSAPESGEGKES